MRAEGPVFHRFEGIDQQGRQIHGAHQDAVLVMNGVDAVDEDRVEAHQGRVLAAAAGIGETDDLAVADLESDETLGLGPVPKLEGTGAEEEVAILALEGPGTQGLGHLTVVQPLQFRHQFRGVQGRARVEFQRAGVDPRRQGPALAFELLPHGAIEGDGVEDQSHHTGQSGQEDCSAQETQGTSEPTTTLARCLLLGGMVFLVLVLIRPAQVFESSRRSVAGIWTVRRTGNLVATWPKNGL